MEMNKKEDKMSKNYTLNTIKNPKRKGNKINAINMV